MGTNNSIVRAEFVDGLPKYVHPEPTDDRATVDFAAGSNQIVILGHVRNGDFRHELTLDEIRLDERSSREELTVELRIREEESEIVMGYTPIFHYRLLVEFDDSIPAEYVIRHFDEEDTKQYEVREILMVDPEAYQEQQSDG